MTGIYKIQSKREPFRIYIGSSVNIEDRWKCHLKKLRKNIHHSRKLQRHYNKHGESDLLFSNIIGCEKEELLQNEQFYIDAYNPWFNVCPIAGNSLGVKRTDEFKLKLSKANKGRPSGMKGRHHSEVAKAKMREKRAGRLQTEESNKKRSIALAGRIKSETTIRKLSESCKGRTISKEQRLSISNKLKGNTNALAHVVPLELKKKNAERLIGNKNMLGKYHSDESKKKMSEAHKGQPSPLKGKKKSKEFCAKISVALRGNKNRLHHYHTPETKERISKSQSRRIIQFDKNMNFIREWDSVRAAVEELSITNSNICSNIKGNRLSAGGFIWRLKVEK